MKPRILLILLSVLISACAELGTQPQAGDGPVVMPRNGARYRYNVTQDSILHSETVRITLTSDGFLATHQPDDNNAAATIDSFYLRADGDLSNFRVAVSPDDRDDQVFPITTQGKYTITSNRPDGSMTATFSYLGAEWVKANDTSYHCSVIGREEDVIPVGAKAYHHSVTYWYSAKAGFFVKEESKSTQDRSLDYVRLLTKIE